MTVPQHRTSPGGSAARGTKPAQGKTIRILQMVWLLQEHNCSVHALAARFGVSRRTVYRDLNLIAKARSRLAESGPAPRQLVDAAQCSGLRP